MAERLPKFVNPYSLAESGRRLTGRLDVTDMPRLGQLLFSAEGQGFIDIDLGWGIDEQGVRFVDGQVDAVLQVPCQRCLQAMWLPVHADVCLGIVSSQQRADMLPGPYEALVTEARNMALKTIVEDELLLALPTVAMHAERDCNPYYADETQDDDGQDKDENPFAVLARLKNKS